MNGIPIPAGGVKVFPANQHGPDQAGVPYFVAGPESPMSETANHSTSDTEMSRETETAGLRWRRP